MTEEPNVLDVQPFGTPNEQKVFLAYAQTMMALQLLEFSVFQLAQLDRKTPNGVERAMKKIEGLLVQPKRDQAKNLKGLPDDLLDDLATVLGVRNRLAHDALLMYRIDSVVTDDAADRAIATFGLIRVFADGLNEALDRAASIKLKDQGIDPVLSEQDEEAILESLRRWSSDLYTPADCEDSASPCP